MSSESFPEPPSQTVPQHSSEPIERVGIDRLRKPNGEPDYDLIDRLQTIRDYIQDQPETKAMFRLSWAGLEIAHRYDATLLTILGSWRVPDRYHSEKSIQYVNPNYAHIESLADGIVQCECGTLVDDARVNRSNDHAEDCTPLNKANARALLWRRREQIIHYSSLCYQNHHYTRKRLNLSERGLKKICERLGINRHDLLDEARSDIGALGADLHPDYTYQEIADLFDISLKTAWRIVNNYRENSNG